MDTNQARTQVTFVAEEIDRQSALVGKRLKFVINKRLIEYFGNRDVAYQRTHIALLVLQDRLGVLKIRNTRIVDLEYGEIDRYEGAWFDIELTDEYFSSTKKGQPDKPKFEAKTGTLHINGMIVEFEPKSRQAVILSLCLQRPKTGVGFNRISDAYENIDRVGLLTSRQIWDDITQINKKITKVLPDITEFLSRTKDTVRST